MAFNLFYHKILNNANNLHFNDDIIYIIFQKKDWLQSTLGQVRLGWVRLGFSLSLFIYSEWVEFTNDKVSVKMCSADWCATSDI